MTYELLFCPIEAQAVGDRPREVYEAMKCSEQAVPLWAVSCFSGSFDAASEDVLMRHQKVLRRGVERCALRPPDTAIRCEFRDGGCLEATQVYKYLSRVGEMWYDCCLGSVPTGSATGSGASPGSSSARSRSSRRIRTGRRSAKNASSRRRRSSTGARRSTSARCTNTGRSWTSWTSSGPTRRASGSRRRSRRATRGATSSGPTACRASGCQRRCANGRRCVIRATNTRW